MSADAGDEIVRLGESVDFLEVDGWRRALERAGIRSRLAQQNDPYLGGRYILYVFRRDVEQAVRVLGWVQDPSLVDPAYAEDAARRGRGAAGGRPFSRYVWLAALALFVAVAFTLLAVFLS